MSFSKIKVAILWRTSILLMNKSETIRALGREGHRVADIARRVGVRYQFVRNVLLAAGLLKKKSLVPLATFASPTPRSAPAHEVKRTGKPELLVEHLIQSGFEHSSRWLLSLEGALVLERALPKAPGVYSIVRDGRALYVGLATMGLAKRIYYYGRPGVTQRTSQRINALLKVELKTAPFSDIYTATPPELEWKGLPVSGMAGLELGLIERFLLPWNMRGVRP